MAPQKNKSNLEQDETILQAAIIADSFDTNFSPVSLTQPRALFPLVNRPVILYTLEFLSASGFQDIYVFCCHKSNEIKSFLTNDKEFRSLSSKIKVISSPDYHSVGDVLRDIDQKSLFQSDFLLVNADLVTNAVITDALAEHRIRRENDKTGPLMTMLLQSCNENIKNLLQGDFTVAVNPSTNQLIHFEQLHPSSSKAHFPLSILSESSVDIYDDLMDIGASICSPQVPQLFTDNFDYQTIGDLVRGVLVNEEFYGNQIHVYILEESFSACMCSFPMYDMVSRSLVSRWVYPLVPENDISWMLNDQISYSHYSQNVYVGRNVIKGTDSSIRRNAVIGQNTKIGNNCKITDSVIGANCQIGDGVVITGSYMWDNVVIGNNCEIKHSFICDHVQVFEKTIIEPRTIVTSKMTVGPNKQTQVGEIISNEEVNEMLRRKYSTSSFGTDQLSDITESIWGLSIMEQSGSEYEIDEFEENLIPEEDLSDEYELDDPDDDLTLFYKEVRDSVQRAWSEEVKCDNLILEINSSKFAYNLSLRDVVVAITKSVLEISKETSPGQFFLTLKKILKYSNPVFLNYNKTALLQLACLQTLQQFFIEQTDLVKNVSKLMMSLYDDDVLNEEVILHWYNQLSDASEIAEMKKRLNPFMTWLQSAEEEDEE